MTSHLCYLRARGMPFSSRSNFQRRQRRDKNCAISKIKTRIHVLTDRTGYKQGRIGVGAEGSKFQLNFNGLLQ
jgi:hypothetical protein